MRFVRHQPDSPASNTWRLHWQSIKVFAAFTAVIIGLALLIAALGIGVIVRAQTDSTATPNPQDIHYGETFNGQLDSDRSKDWFFVGAPGDIVRIQAVRTVGDLLLGITISDQNGRSLAGVQAVDTGSVTLSDVALIQPAVYTIHVTGLAHTSGAYQLTLLNTGTSGTPVASATPVSQLLTGTIAIGQPVHSTLDDVNYHQVWRFAGTIGDVIDVQMRVTSGDLLAFVALISPAGDVVTTSAAQTGLSGATEPIRDATIFSVQLASSGSYQLLARRQGDQQGQLGLSHGSYDLTITSHSLAPSIQNTILLPGAALTGRLTSIAPINQYQITSGGIFVFRLAFQNLHRIARVRILDSTGLELDSKSGLSPLTFSESLPSKGPFSVQVSADIFDNQLATDFTLNLYKITSPAIPIGYNSSQRGQIGPSPDRWVFIGQAGDLIRLHINPDTDAGTASVALYGPQDVNLFQSVIGPTFDQAIILPADGTYQIAFQASASNSASLAYQITIDRDGVNGLPFARFGVTASSGSLGFSNPTTGTVPSLGSQTWTLDMVAGQTINVTAVAQTLAQPFGVIIRAPDESILATQYDSGSVQIRRALLPISGRYSLIVFNPMTGQPVPYTVQMEDAGGGILNDNTVKGVVVPTNTFAEWSVDASAGALITAQLTTRTPAAWTAGLILLDPSGLTLARAGVGLDRSTFDLTGIRVSVTGHYRLVVVGTVAAAFASYELRASAQISSIASAGGTSLVVLPATTAPVIRFSGTVPADLPSIISPTLSDLLDPALPLDPSPSAVQTMLFNTLLRGEIAPGTLRQVWRAVTAGGSSLNLRAVSLGSARGPDLALFDDKQHIVAEQLHGASPDTTLTYFNASGGPYYLAVRLGLDSGRYTLYAESQTLTSGSLQIAQGTPLLYGQSANGELVIPDQPAQTDNYYFLGAANDVIDVSAARVTGNLAPSVQLNTVAGQPLIDRLNVSGDAVSTITAFRLPNNGVYTIQVRRSAAAQTSNGRYLLTLGLTSTVQLKNQLSGILLPDQNVYGLLSGNITQNTWLLTGHAGQTISLVLTGLSASNAPTPLSLKLQDIAGNTFAQQDIFSSQDSAQLVGIMLPHDSLYRVQVMGGSLTSGSYRLQWLSQKTQSSGIIHFGQTVSGLFTTTQPADKWTFTGTVGDVIALSLRRRYGDSFHGAFQILSAGGATLASAADLGTGEGARVDSLSLPFSGTYTVVVVNPDSTFKGAGVYTLGLTLQDTKARAMGGILADGQTGTGELYPDDAVHTWLFNGHGGDVVTIQGVAQDHFLQPVVTLKNTSDQALVNATAANGAATINSFKLPANGVYAVAVSGANHSSGSYRIRLTFAPPPIVALATIKYGISTVGLIADDRQTNLFLFSGQPGDRITAQAMREAGSTLALTLELRTNSGDLLAHSDALGGEQAAINDFVLPDGGTYRLIVGRFGGANGHTSGRLTIALNGQVANFPIRGVIKPGVLVQGRVDDATLSERWTFDGKAGQVISLRSKATSGDLDTVLDLYAPDATRIARNDDYDGTNAVLPGVALPVDGTYTIILSRVGTRNHGSAGNYDLQFDTLFTLPSAGTAAAITGTPIGYAQRVVGTIDNTHPEAHWTFESRAGDTVQITLIHPSDDAPPSLSIQDPSGSNLVTGTLHVGQTTIDSYQLPTSGFFNISVKRPINAHASYSPYALTLTLLGTGVDTGISTGGPLSTDSSIIGQISTNHPLNLWLIQANAGQSLTLTVTPFTRELMTDIQVIDPGGRLLLTQSTPLDSSGHEFRVDSLTLPIGGLYAVIITPHMANQNGTYRLISHLASLPDSAAVIPTLAPNKTIQSALTELHPVERWQIQAAAGQSISAQLLVTSGDWQPLLQLVSADGLFIAASRLDQTPLGTVAVIESAVIPTDGSYILMVSRNGTASGNYALTFGAGSLVTVQTLASQPIRYGQTVQAVISPIQPALWAFDAQKNDVVDVIVQSGVVGSVGTVLDAPGFTVMDATGHIIDQAAPIVHESDAASLVLPASGRYIIGLNSNNASGYSLTVQNRPATLPAKLTARTLVNGTSQQNGIDSNTLNDYWTFNAQSGDGVQIRLARVSGDLRINVSLYGPNGYVIGTAADAQTAQVTLGGLRLPDTGTYTVVVGRWLGAAGKTSGGYAITLNTVDVSAPTMVPTLGQSMVNPRLVFSSTTAIRLTDQGNLTFNADAEANLTADQIGHQWTIDAQSSPTIAAEIVSESASLTLHAVLVTTNGQAIGLSDSDPTGRLMIEVPLPAVGRYTLQIRPNSPGQTGRYRIRVIYALSPLGGGRLVSGMLVTGSLTDAHFTDSWRFEAQNNSLLKIDANLVSGDTRLAYVLIDPTGNIISPTPEEAANQSAVTSTGVHLTLMVPGAGSYSLLVTRQGGANSQPNSSYQLIVRITLPTF